MICYSAKRIAQLENINRIMQLHRSLSYEICWIYRNDEPAHTAEAHAYKNDNDVSLCGKHDRSKFDWTEMDGERCIRCQQLARE